MSQPKFSILWSMSFILSIGCASRPLASPDDFEEFNKTSRECKNAYIYFLDSTYSTAISLETDGHMLYWTDRDTKTSQENLLRDVDKIVFQTHRMNAGVGACGLAGTLAASMIITANYDDPIYKWKSYRIFSYEGLALLALSMPTGGIIGATLGYSIGTPITYTVRHNVQK